MESKEEQRAKKFYELRQSGTTVEEIASTYFLSVARVKSIIRDYERENQVPRAKTHISSSTPRMREFTEKAEEFYELQLKGKTANEIASMYNIPPSKVYYAIARYKREHQLSRPIATRRETTKQRKGSDDRDRRAEEFRDLKLKGATFEDIATMQGLSRSRVMQIIDQYERKYNLPSSTHAGRELVKKAKQADIEEYKVEQRIENQKQYKRFVPSFQLDAHLIGRFLYELGKRSVLYSFAGKSRMNPRGRKDGSPFLSMSTPTNIFFTYGTKIDRKRVTLHAWVLQQYGIKMEEGQHCHHIDGDITNNMLENLQVMSGEDHGRLTMQEQRASGIIRDWKPPRKLTGEQVEEIRALYQPGIMSLAKLAAMYDVSQQTIWLVVYGQGAYSDVNPASRHIRKPESNFQVKQILLDFDT